MSDEYTKFQKARVIGARALQISMGAPILVKLEKDEVSTINIAERELKEGVIPITIKD